MLKHMLILCLLIVFPPTYAAEDKMNDSEKVEGVLSIAKGLASFSDSRIELILYRYRSNTRDRKAEAVGTLTLLEFTHQQGQEDEKNFIIGKDSPRDPASSYYLSVYVVKDGTRTHIGKCATSPDKQCTVLDGKHPGKVQIIIEPLPSSPPPSASAPVSHWK